MEEIIGKLFDEGRVYELYSLGFTGGLFCLYYFMETIRDGDFADDNIFKLSGTNEIINGYLEDLIDMYKDSKGDIAIFFNEPPGTKH